MRASAFAATVIRRPPQVCAALAGALALFALLAWTAGDWRIVACGGQLIPIAPSTALAILLLSGAVFVYGRRPAGRFARAGVHAAAFGAAALGLLVWMQTRFGWELPLEGWLSGCTDRLGSVPVGRMSPLTAAALVLCALAFWLAAPPLGRRWPCRQAAAVATLAVLAIGLVVLLSYAAGIPLLYGTPTIPMAFLTAVALVLLALAVLGGTGGDTFPLCLLQSAAEADSRPPRGWLIGAPLLIFLFLAAGIGAVGYYYFALQVAASREAAEQQLSAVADMKVRQVSTWYAERLRDARFFFETPHLAELARGSAADPPTSEDRQRLLAVMTSARKNFQYGRVLLVDRDRRVRLAVPADRDWLGPTAESFAARALETGRIQVSDLHASRKRPGTIDMDVFVPLLPEATGGDARPEPAGVLVFEINPQEFLFPVVQSWPTPSRSAETLLVRREGDEVVYLNELRHENGTALTLRMPLGRTDIPAVRAALGEEGILEGPDYRDVPVLTVARAVPGTPWFLVAKVDQAEVLAPVRAQALLTAVLVLLFLTAAALGVGLMGRRRDTRWLRSQLAVERDYAAALESANRALEEFNHKAEAATRAKSEFLANMSHEIRTPMTAILGYADLIADGCPGHCPYGSGEMQPAVAVIRRNGEHLLALISDILDLSKIEAGKFELSLVRRSPSDLLADVASLMRGRAEAKRLKLETEIAGPMPETILTDPLRLRQILINLTGNAVKFTDRGTVRLSARLIDDGAGAWVRFDVSDTGIGMSDEQIERLFRPFSQVDNSASRRFGGSGLGLAISKRLAEALGGMITVESVPDRGSTFSVIVPPGPLDGIPLLQAAAVPAPPPVPDAPPAAAGSAAVELRARVLLAEDGPDNQRLIGLVLKKAGADVTTVDNGQLAVEAALAQDAAGNPFDVILMDMQMPVMDGYDATRTLRERGHAGAILALTAHSMADDRQKCLDAGCDEYLSKPIDRRGLLRAVAEWSGEPRASARG